MSESLGHEAGWFTLQQRAAVHQVLCVCCWRLFCPTTADGWKRGHSQLHWQKQWRRRAGRAFKAPRKISMGEQLGSFEVPQSWGLHYV